MRIKLKINPKTGIIYLPKVLLEDGFTGEVDAFGSGPVLVIIRPHADVKTVKDRLKSVSKEIDLRRDIQQFMFDDSGKEL